MEKVRNGSQPQAHANDSVPSDHALAMREVADSFRPTCDPESGRCRLTGKSAIRLQLCSEFADYIAENQRRLALLLLLPSRDDPHMPFTMPMFFALISFESCP